MVGLDCSADQLRIAQRRSGQVVQGDAATLPFADCTFPTVAAMWISTDVDDFAAVLAEAARVLTRGGLLVFYGAHPCFNGPHTQWMDDGGMRAHPTYRLTGWHQPAPWWGEYVRRRVGMRQHTLADVLNAFITAGLAIEHVAKLGDRPVPMILGIRAHSELPGSEGADHAVDVAAEQVAERVVSRVHLGEHQARRGAGLAELAQARERGGGRYARVVVRVVRQRQLAEVVSSSSIPARAPGRTR